jgi:hypothetical protein
VPVPYEASASLGPDFISDGSGPVDIAGGEGPLFQRTTEFLAGTSSFQGAKFYRVLRLEQSKESGPKEVEFASGVGYRLRSGKAYQLVILHSQPREVTSRATFDLSADASTARVVGRQGFEMASRYDVASIPILAADLPGATTREGILQISPASGIQGPVLTLPLRLEPETLKTTGALVASVLGLVLIGLTGIVSTGQPLLAFGALIGGTALATIVPLFMTGRTPWSG